MSNGIDDDTSDGSPLLARVQLLESTDDGTLFGTCSTAEFISQRKRKEVPSDESDESDPQISVQVSTADRSPVFSQSVDQSEDSSLPEGKSFLKKTKKIENSPEIQVHSSIRKSVEPGSMQKSSSTQKKAKQPKTSKTRTSATSKHPKIARKDPNKPKPFPKEITDLCPMKTSSSEATEVVKPGLSTETPQDMLSSIIAQLEEQITEERRRNEELQAELISERTRQERQIIDLRSSYDGELLRLQNTITQLQSKLRRPPSPSVSESLRAQSPSKNHLCSSLTPASGDNVSRWQRELEQQEKLIAGYQRENERLYKEIKELQQVKQPTNDSVETAERLANENASLRMEVDRLEKENQQRARRLEEILSKYTDRERMDRTSELEEQIAELQTKLDKVSGERDDARADLAVLSKKIDHIISENRSLSEELENVKSKNEMDRSILIDQHKQAVGEYKKKLRWYIENQALVNRDAIKLRKQAEEIDRLNQELAQTKTLPSHATPRNQTLRGTPESGTPPAIFEQRIRSLEAEVERVRENEKRAIRSLQQQYEAVKFQYEDRIHALEQQVEAQLCAINPKPKKDEQIQKDGSPNRSKNTIVLDEDESQSVKCLLKKLRNQIGNLKKELTTRQRSIEELQRVAYLNASATTMPEVSQHNRKRVVRHCLTQKRSSKRPIIVQVPPREINNLRYHPRMYQTPLTRTIPKSASETSLQSDYLFQKTGISRGQKIPRPSTHTYTGEDKTLTTSRSRTLTVEDAANDPSVVTQLQEKIDDQTTAIHQLQSQLSNLRSSCQSLTDQVIDDRAINPKAVQDYFLGACQKLLDQLEHEYSRAAKYHHQLATLSTLHQDTAVGKSPDELTNRLSDDPPEFEWIIDHRYNQKETGPARCPIPCSCEPTLQEASKNVDYSHAFGKEKTQELNQLRADADMLVNILTELKEGQKRI
ncbi:unnamed protein product [Calicophoron daubneyi]|uniref:Centrosomal protein of 162 kDa n=1 Tax=Calicophoron daubneyi TaxID=300641 RepID=A0AAV2TZI1_CALDB